MIRDRFFLRLLKIEMPKQTEKMKTTPIAEKKIT